jgi:hypothetical protein
MMEDDQDAPDITILWDRKPVARIEHRCQRCGDPILPGTRYHSYGLIVDGEREITKQHEGANNYPSACPKIGMKEAGEMADQFIKDQTDLFPQ